MWPFKKNKEVQPVKKLKYNPQKDITTYEVALLLPIFHFYATCRFCDKKPETFTNWKLVKRHFKRIN